MNETFKRVLLQFVNFPYASSYQCTDLMYNIDICTYVVQGTFLTQCTSDV